MTAPIESYGMIGDCKTAALVGSDGSIDWLCWPRFDSDACFAKLLGGQSNGFWLITPHEELKATSRCYRKDTLILETTFETDSGKATVIDFMLPRGASSDLVRIVRGDEGEVALCMELVLRFGYGATTPWVTRLKDAAVRAVAGPDMVVLRSPANIRGENFKTVAQFTLTKGKTMPFVLSYQPSHLSLPEPIDPNDALKKCEQYWKEWTASTKTEGPHSEAIKRSAKSGAAVDGDLDELKRLLVEEQSEIRGFVMALRQHRDLELAEAVAELRALAGRLGHQWSVDCHVSAEGDEVAIPIRLQLDLQQLLREAVANAVRHGGADRIDVGLSVARGEVQLRVVDNGSGFAPGEGGAAAEPWSLKERVERAHGSLRLDSAPGSTNVLISLPLKGVAA